MHRIKSERINSTFLMSINSAERDRIGKVERRLWIYMGAPNFRSRSSQNPPRSPSLPPIDVAWQCSQDASWKLKPHFPRGPSCQPRASDDSSAQAGARSSAASNGSTIRRLPCCCSAAARSDGPDGNHCCWCGCGFCHRPHSGSGHHWGLQWRKQCWTVKAWHHLPGASGNPAGTTAAEWPLLLWGQTVFGACSEPGWP